MAHFLREHPGNRAALDLLARGLHRIDEVLLGGNPDLTEEHQPDAFGGLAELPLLLADHRGLVDLLVQRERVVEARTEIVIAEQQPDHLAQRVRGRLG